MNMHEKLQVGIQNTKNILNSLGINYGPIEDVVINFRAKHRWGQCSYNRLTGNFTIEVSSRLLCSDVKPEALVNTLLHEFLHANKNRMSHTGEWKRCADLINRRYPVYNITRCSSAEEIGITDDRAIETYKYKITCNGCGIVNYYSRKGKIVTALMKNPRACRCTKCGGDNFSVVTL